MKKELDMLIEDIELEFEKCPWMKEQTLESYGKEPLDEAQEVIQAIKNNDNKNLKEELGDLLRDVLVLTMIAEKDGKLKTKEVIELLREKMHRRQPWVFGDMKIKDAKEALKIWNEIKSREKSNDEVN